MLYPIEQFRQQYEIGEEIGRGAFAICYKATNKSSRMVVAAKKISILAEDEQIKQSISNQVLLLKSLAHPNIIQFIAAYGNKSYAIILTKYEQGRDLQHKIAQFKRENKRFTQKQIMSIFWQSLQGLAYLHSNNIIHRDIKPSNIFINQFDQIKIGDLGASKIIGQFNYTRIGTPYYLSPQIIRHQNYSFSADIWSLGVTLYHLLYLEPPFKANNIIKLGQLIIESEPSFCSQTCQVLESAIRRMLAKNQKERPSAQQLLWDYFKEDRQNEKAIAEILQEEQEILAQPNREINKDQKSESVISLNYQQQQNELQRGEESTVNQISICTTIVVNSQNRDAIFGDNFDSPLPFQCTKKLTKERSKQNRFLERKQSHINKQAIDQNESTIVLTVSVNSTQGRNQTSAVTQSSKKRTFFLNQSIVQIKSIKRTSLFKDCARQELPYTSASNFYQSKMGAKSQKSDYVHKRQSSVIQKRQKHNQLMQKIKPLKVTTTLNFHQSQANLQEKQKPKITVDVPSIILLR